MLRSFAACTSIIHRVSSRTYTRLLLLGIHHIMRTYTFHVPTSLTQRCIALDRSDHPSLTDHAAYTCVLATDAQCIAIAHTLDCDPIITRDTDSDDYSRSFGDTSAHRVSSRFDVATRTLTFHRDKTGFEIAYAIGVDSSVQRMQ